MASDDSEKNAESTSTEETGTLQAITSIDGVKAEIAKKQPDLAALSRPMIKVNNLAEREHLKGKSSRERRTIIDPFGVADLVINPQEVLPEETITISFKATNNSDVYSIYTINIKINREVVAAEVMKLPPGVSVPMYFTVKRNLPGDYAVKVNHLAGKFRIIGNISETPKEELKFPDVEALDSSARFELGLSEVDAYLQQKQALNAKNVRSANRLQSGINKVASIIELSLDKMGDGIIFPMAKLADISTKLIKVLRRYKTK